MKKKHYILSAVVLLVILAIAFIFMVSDFTQEDIPIEPQIEVENTTKPEENSEDLNESEDESIELSRSVDIYTKDLFIDYVTNDENFMNTMMSKLTEDTLQYLEYDELIRVVLPSPAVSMYLEKRSILNDNTVDAETQVLDGTLLEVDLTNLYPKEHDIQAIIYNLQFKFENDDIYNYSFGIKTLDYNTPTEEIPTITGYLSYEEQFVYEDYKSTFDKVNLQGFDAISMAKLYVQSVMEGAYDVSYSLLTKSNTIAIDKPEEENFINGFNETSPSVKEEYIYSIKNIENGEFILINENEGYIQYENTPDHPLAIGMIKVDGIWLVEYIPN